jgi:hypothetical protein
MKVENVLWLQNLGTSDVSLSDLGVKIPAGKTINVYQWNPYIKPEQVEKSKTSGSLAKRLESKLLKIVAGPAAAKITNRIKESKQIVTAKKTKSSIVIEPESVDEENGEKFEFADYGIGDIKKIEKEQDAVIVNVKQDEEEAIKQPHSIGSQSKKIMEDFQQKAVNPIGPLAEISSPNNSFVSVKPPAKPETPKPAKPEVKKSVAGSIVVGEQTDQPRSINAIKNDVQDESVVGDTQESVDKVIKTEAPKEEGMRVAKRTTEGVIIMELKEEEPAKTSDKPVVKKTNKKK